MNKIDELNNRMRTLKTYEELQGFLKDVYRSNFILESKRGHKKAFEFTKNENDEDRVDYLYDDGVSYGSCKISELYKYLKVHE